MEGLDQETDAATRGPAADQDPLTASADDPGVVAEAVTINTDQKGNKKRFFKSGNRTHKLYIIIIFLDDQILFNEKLDCQKKPCSVSANKQKKREINLQ